MDFSYNSLGHPVMFKITCETKGPVPIRFLVKDSARPNTMYMNRFNTINGIDSVYIRLPNSPQLTLFRVINDKTGGDHGFKIVGKDKLPLETSMSLVDFKNPTLASFVKFAEQFADRAGYYSPGTYLSDNSRFQINYVPKIIGDRGVELNTPARVNADTRIVEVSQKIFKDYVVAGRFAVLLHEFSHVFANKNMKDEIEADLHAAQIYLAMGYPRIELLNVFGKVFAGADNSQNRQRFDLMEKYITNFDKNIIKVQYY